MSRCDGVIDKPCPKCGCDRFVSGGNSEEYPNHWERFYCEECNWLVAEVDNSPLISCYEFDDFVIEI